MCPKESSLGWCARSESSRRIAVRLDWLLDAWRTRFIPNNGAPTLFFRTDATEFPVQVW